MGMFGDQDIIFALHSADKDRAFEILKEVYNQKVPWSEFQDKVRDAIENKIRARLQRPLIQGDYEHIDKQMKKVEAYFKPWLE
jgi:hypothetical protein